MRSEGVQQRNKMQYAAEPELANLVAFIQKILTRQYKFTIRKD